MAAHCDKLIMTRSGDTTGPKPRSAFATVMVSTLRPVSFRRKRFQPFGRGQRQPLLRTREQQIAMPIDATEPYYDFFCEELTNIKSGDAGWRKVSPTDNRNS